jgi:hypothetical protein
MENQKDCRLISFTALLSSLIASCTVLKYQLLGHDRGRIPLDCCFYCPVFSSRKKEIKDFKKCHP